MHQLSQRQQIVLSCLFFVFTISLSPGLTGFIWDLGLLRNWAVNIHEKGLCNTYSSGTDYLPLFQYMLAAFVKLAGSVDDINRTICYFRMLPLAADYFALWIVYRWIDRRVDYVFLLLCGMLNIGFSYNTVIWGQVDGIFTALIITSLYLLHRGKPFWSALVMVLAINSKLQAVIFVPLWGLLMITELHRSRRWKAVLYIVPTMLLLQALILTPFAFGKGGVAAVWRVVSGSVGIFPYLTCNASNVWYWIVPDLSRETRDDVHTVIGLTYMQIGLLSFYAASFITLWPLLRHTILTLAGRTSALFPKEKLWFSAALIALVFYYFNTQMHERYCHPAFIFLTAYAFCNNRYGLYILFSIAYFLSLERVLQWLRLANYDTLIFEPRFIAVLFAIAIVWLLFLLYRRHSAGDKAVPRRHPGKAETSAL